MDFLSPVYTEKTECHDCFKCVRNCPVKAISFKNGHARIDSSLCIFCGKCVSVCPSNAKRGRDEIGRVSALLDSGGKIILSIAPSFPGEFSEYSTSQMIGSLKSLGFSGVSETALGAEYVSFSAAEKLERSSEKIIISSACPSIVEYIKKYKKDIAPLVSDQVSPLLAHCRMLKQIDDEIQIVFAGPCLSKKKEADDNPGLIAAVITFEDIRTLFDMKGIHPESISGEYSFYPRSAGQASLYPLDGGMCESIRSYSSCTNTVFMSLSGMDEAETALDNLPEPEKGENIFIEMLSCRGGCINGPKSRRPGETVRKRLDVIKHHDSEKKEYKLQTADFSMTCMRNITVPEIKKHSENEIAAALAAVGKNTPEDELNCGGCGYNTCRDFAGAILDSKAEEVMCISYMRSLAQKKANAIIEMMPSGVVIADSSLSIIESNRRFAELLGEEALLVWESKPNLTGANLEKMVPFYSLFNQVLESGREIIDKKVEYRDKILNITVFIIQKGQVAGAILQDITIPWVNRDRVVKNARKVIHKNLETVQKIAYLLGENAGENEVILNEIIHSFSGMESEVGGK